MRHTAIASELITYIPAVILYGCLFTSSLVDRTSTILLVLLQPGLTLIDHGHFQYNSVMLGFLVFTLYFSSKGCYNIGAACFVCCLSFKQMGLYYAPAIFAFLLSKTLRDLPMFCGVAVSTISVFSFCYGPFLATGGVAGLQQVLVRMFPFGRGLFEDKVANFWCALNVVYKIRSFWSNAALHRFR